MSYALAPYILMILVGLVLFVAVLAYGSAGRRSSKQDRRED